MTNQGKLLIVVILAIVGAGFGAYILLGANRSETPQETLLENPEFEEQAPIDGSSIENGTTEEEPVSEEEPLALITVNYTNSGFVTASVSESVNTIVRFRNQS